MDLNELKKLKSGTDVRGIAIGENITLTDEAIAAIAKAFCFWLSRKFKLNEIKVAVGHDSRLTAAHISSVVNTALISSGADVIFTGLSSTPSMYMLLKENFFGCNASVMITASHLPYDRNGLKFFTPSGGLSSNDIDEILYLASENTALAGAGRYFEQPFMDEYSRMLVDKVESVCGHEPLKGRKIIVDAGNGAGGFFAEKVLIPLGADVSGSLYLEPDGTFPHHAPNPEDKKAIECLSEAVVSSNADMGIIFDTDVDRAACVDSNGKEINRNLLIALVAAIVLPEKGGIIVTDSATSIHLTEFITSLGGTHLRYKRGYKNVIDKCRELNDGGVYSPVAIETSGHAAFPENYYQDDGAYLMTKILTFFAKQKDGKNVSDLISGLKLPAEECEVRISFNSNGANYLSEGNKVIEDLKELTNSSAEFTSDSINYEGVMFGFEKSHILVRKSVHDPVMPINIESDEVGGAKRAAEKLLSILKAYDFLNLDNLKKYING